MSAYSDNYINRILEASSLPLMERCIELTALFNRGSLRELQYMFPSLVQAVFGIGSCGLGWGLRSVTKENSSHTFDMLFNFFSPTGPMFGLCYRLLNDAIKFELPLDVLPPKLVDLIQSGQYSMFYADLLIVDHYRRQVTSLSLNAFDYYLLHFAIHATYPLHKLYPAALQVHNERTKTVYLYLTAEYLGNFLPSRPDAVVLPHNICTSVKAPQPMPVQPLQPKRTLKYLKIPQSNQGLYGPGAGNMCQMSPRNADALPMRAYAWRTESVLHLFIDIWLRFDADCTGDLPSSEFIRVVRILIKQTHIFANYAHLDQSSMASLRKSAQPMMKALVYPLLKSLIGRWPKENSFSNVLELWLSYIQPWCYTFEWNNLTREQRLHAPIDNRFDLFISENLVVYTQILVRILPRFDCMDLNLLRNTIMLHRLSRAFSQPSLADKLYEAEAAYAGNTIGFDSPRRQNTFLGCSNSFSVWEGGLFHEDVYTPMFGSEIRSEVESIIKNAQIARMKVIRDINAIKQEQSDRRKTLGFFRIIFLRLFSKEDPLEIKLQEISSIPDALEMAARSLCQVFHTTMPDISMELLEPTTAVQSLQNFSVYDNSDYLDISRFSPAQMNNNLANMRCTIDPAVMPVQSDECETLVKLLHQISCCFNQKFGNEFETSWNRGDFVGKLTHQLLYPPMTAQWFDKPKGVSELCEEELPARLCLRVLASYRTLALVGLAMLIGYIWCSSCTIGVIVLLSFWVMYVLVMALVS